jgi:hypothetical protein
MYIPIDYWRLRDHYRQGILRSSNYQEICLLYHVQLDRIWATEVTATILRFASHAFWLLRFWNHGKSIVSRIALDVLKRKSYPLFHLVLMKYTLSHQIPRIYRTCNHYLEKLTANDNNTFLHREYNMTISKSSESWENSRFFMMLPYIKNILVFYLPPSELLWDYLKHFCISL